MPRHTVRVAAGVLAVLGLLTACGGGGKAGTATPPVNSSAPSSSGGTNVDPSLKVASPLPTQALANDPCTALGDSDATTIGFAAPGKPFGADGLKACQWISANYPENSMTIAPLTPKSDGISGIYANKNQYAYFEMAKVNDYPAVFANRSDNRSIGGCTLWVGVTDQLVVNVSPQIGTGQYHTDPCGLAQKMATAMVNHLKTTS